MCEDRYTLEDAKQIVLEDMAIFVFEELQFLLRMWIIKEEMSSICTPQYTVGYELFDLTYSKATPVFKGSEYGPSCLHAPFSSTSVGTLLAFLSLKPGDVEDEYFERHEYTPEQLAWCKTIRSEELSILASDLENEDEEENV